MSAEPLDAGPASDPAAPAPTSDTPPKPKIGRPPGAKNKRPPADRPPTTAAQAAGKRTSGLAKRLEAQIASLGLMVSVANPVDGMAILNGAPKLAEALDHAAAQNPRLRKTLERLLQTSIYGELAAAVAMIALPIAANHGILPEPAASMFAAGTPAPFTVVPGESA